MTKERDNAVFSDSVKVAWVTYYQVLRNLPDHSNWTTKA